MGINEAKWTATQREAVASAVEDRGIGATEVARLAAAGHIEHEGIRLEPFPIPAATVRTYALRLRKTRAGKAAAPIADLEPRDATETLRRRLATLVDDRLAAAERKKKGTTDPEELRQMARAIREFAAIPAKTDPRPAAPGARVNGAPRTEGETKGGLSGPLVADHRRTTGKAQPAPSADPQRDEGGEHRGTSAPTTTTEAHDAEPTEQPADHSSPGSVVRALAERLGEDLATIPTGG